MFSKAVFKSKLRALTVKHFLTLAVVLKVMLNTLKSAQLNLVKSHNDLEINQEAYIL